MLKNHFFIKNIGQLNKLNTKITPITINISWNYSNISLKHNRFIKYGHFVLIYFVLVTSNNTDFITHNDYTILGNIPAAYRPTYLVTAPITTSQSIRGQNAFFEVRTDGNICIYQYGDNNSTWANVNIIYYVE